jgi:HPt (histidine-containing phosphotransfer) domain-containing protein
LNGGHKLVRVERLLEIVSAKKSAHNLAGTAACSESEGLGDLAAAVEDTLKADAENGLTGIERLLEALRRAA